MNKIIRKILDWGLMWIWIILIFWIVYAVDFSVNSGETLTADKWNELVDSVSWIYTDDSWNVWIWTQSPNVKLEVTWWNTILEQSDWISPTFENSWKNYWGSYSEIWYFKDSLWVVHLRGMMSWGLIGNAYCAFTLIEWYRPESTLLNVTISNSWLSRLDIRSNWCVVALVWWNSRFSLDGITFSVN